MAFDTGGAAAGALSGAAAGTALMPGIGTAIGAVGGGLLGGFFGGGAEPEMTPEEKELRARQMANLRSLSMAASGQGPTAAQQMVEHNRAENAAQQIGYAKTLGGDPALANRLAAEGIVRGNAEASYQGAQLRAQEQQNAMNLYTQALGQARGADSTYTNLQNNMAAAEAERRRQMAGGMMNSAAGTVGGFF